MWKGLRSRLSFGGRRSGGHAVTHLSVDGRVRPLHREFALFTQAASLSGDQDVALLATTFRAFASLPSEMPPAVRLIGAPGQDIDAISRSALYCLRCFTEHSISMLALEPLAGRDPQLACVNCGCPDAVLVHDRRRSAGHREPQVIRHVDGTGW